MLNVSKIVCSAALCVALGTVATAASNTNKGTTPNGKPFVKINKDLASLQEQIDMLVGRVDTIEDRSSALELAVADIEVKNAELEVMINEGVDVAENLQAQIDNNTRLIARMQAEIDAIKENLEMKQNIINGVCPAGEVVIGMTENSLACAPISSQEAEEGEYFTYINITYRKLAANTSYPTGEHFLSVCERNHGRIRDIATGGGFQALPVVQVIRAYAGGIYGHVQAINEVPYSNYIYNKVTCLGKK